MQNNMARLDFANQEQASINQQQATLDRQQVELQRRQAQVAIQAARLSRALIDQSFRQGLARPL